MLVKRLCMSFGMIKLSLNMEIKHGYVTPIALLYMLKQMIFIKILLMMLKDCLILRIMIKRVKDLFQ